jgi:2-oxoglutarate dehydrogenase E2 component (dihydrolipoamide succinyltransferase)
MAAVPVTVPSVGESISEGILARWLKSDGQSVNAGEPLFELETDKASSVVPAVSAGALKIQVKEGETVAIGSVVATIDPASSGSVAAAAPAAPATQAARAVEPAPTSAAADGKPVDGAVAFPPSPAVRRLATEEGVDLGKVAATGPGGRITKGDVVGFLDSKATPSAPTKPAPAPAPAQVTPATVSVPASSGPRESRQRMSGLRQKIAQRLVEVQQTAAILTTFNEIDMSRTMELRTRYKESFQTKHGVGLGFMSFFVKATIEALKAYPAVNGRIDGNEIVYHNFYDIGVAVSTDRGLMVPVIRDADRLSFAAIEKAIGGFAAKAREGKITVDDLQGGTFTITNGGTFGSLMSTPIINPPQSGILGMHAIKKRPIAVDDAVVVRPMMYVALSYDHRLIDGREAVSFLVRIKDLVENPERLLFEI